MSRSYKKAVMNACADKSRKNEANKLIRNSVDVPNGRSYKKYFESYNIVDACFDDRFRKEETVVAR